jgi:phosphatidylglycerol:prolipoprotein diacylglycerol transferase
MIQELFHIGPLSISPFGVTMVLAFVAAFFQLRWGLRRLAIGSEDDASAITLAAGIGGILGAKVYYALLYRDLGLLFSRSGLVWYGGFILAVVGILWTVRRRRLPLWGTLDAGAVALALGYGIGRIGCFLVGDDYGVPTDQPWGVIFPHGLPPTTAANLRSLFGVDIPANVPPGELLAVHPTQLYETALALLIWWIGLKLLRQPRSGTALLGVVSLLAVERFLVEFLRAKDDRFLAGLTLAQGISLAVVLLCVVLWRFRGSVTAVATHPRPKRKKA